MLNFIVHFQILLFFPFMSPTNSHYIAFVTACWSSYLSAKLAELSDLYMLKVGRKKREESIDLI